MRMSLFHAIYGSGSTPGGTTHGEVQTLLWENSTPKAVFNAQTVAINLTNYDGVIIEMYDKITSETQSVVSIIKLPKGITYAHGGGYKGSSDQSATARNVTAITDSGITFDNSWSTTSGGTLLIPYRIYGYKQYEAGSITGDYGSVSVSANKDVTVEPNSYYLAAPVGATMEELSASKGTIITGLYKSALASSFIVKSTSDGKINLSVNTSLKKLSVGD